MKKSRIIFWTIFAVIILAGGGWLWRDYQRNEAVNQQIEENRKWMDENLN